MVQDVEPKLSPPSVHSSKSQTPSLLLSSPGESRLSLSKSKSSKSGRLKQAHEKQQQLELELQLKENLISSLQDELKTSERLMNEIREKLEQTESRLEETAEKLDQEQDANRSNEENQRLGLLEVENSSLKNKLELATDRLGDLEEEQKQNRLTEKTLLRQLHEKDQALQETASQNRQASSKISNLLSQIAQQESALSQSDQRIQALQKQVHAMEIQQVQMKEDASNTMDQHMRPLHDEISLLRQEISGLKISLQQSKKENHNLQDDVDAAKQDKVKLQETVQKLQFEQTEDLKATKQQLQSTKQVLSELRESNIRHEITIKELTRYRHLIDQYSETNQVSDSRDKLNAILNANLVQAVNLQTVLRNEVAQYKHQNNLIRLEKEEVQRLMEIRQGMIRNLQSDLKRMMNEGELQVSEMKALKNRSNQKDIQINKLQYEIQQAEMKVKEQQRDHTSLNTQLQEALTEISQLKTKKTQLKKLKSFQPLPFQEEVSHLRDQITRYLKRNHKSEVITSMLRQSEKLMDKLLSFDQDNHENFQKITHQNDVLRQKIEKLNTLYYRAQSEIKLSQSKKLHLEKELQVQRDRESRLCEQEMKKYEDQSKILSSQLRQTNREILRMDQLIQQLKVERQDLRNQLDAQQIELQKKEDGHLKIYSQATREAAKNAATLNEEMKKYFNERVLKVLTSPDEDKIQHLLNENYALKMAEKAILEEMMECRGARENLQSRLLIQENLVERLEAQIKVLNKPTTSLQTNHLEEQLSSVQDNYQSLLKSYHHNGGAQDEELQKKMIHDEKKHKKEMSKVQKNAEEKLQEKETLINKLRHENALYKESLNKITSEKENMVDNKSYNTLISRVATQKIKLEESKSLIQERDLQIKDLNKVLKKKFKKKKFSLEMDKQMSKLLKNRSQVQVKLQRAIQNEIQLRQTIEERDKRIAVLREAVKAMQQNMAKGKRILPTQKLTSAKLTENLLEKETENNHLRLELAQMRQTLEEENKETAKSTREYIEKVRAHEKRMEKMKSELRIEFDTSTQLKKQVNLLNEQNVSLKLKYEKEHHQMVEQLGAMKEQHEKLHEEMSEQNRLYVELKVELGKQNSSLSEKNHLIEEMDQTKRRLLRQIEELKEQLQEKKLQFEKNQIILDENLDKTLSNLQQEQTNVQRLMTLVAKLRRDNDELQEDAMDAKKLRIQVREIQERLEETTAQRNDFEGQLAEAKVYLRTMKEEREDTQRVNREERQDLKQEIEKKNLEIKEVQKKHLLEVDRLVRLMESDKDESRDQNAQIKEEYNNRLMELKNDLDKEKKEMFEDRLTYQRNEHRMQKELDQLRRENEIQLNKHQDLELITARDKEEGLRQIEQVKGDFQKYKEAQERVVTAYEKQFKQLQSKVSSGERSQRQLKDTQTKLSKAQSEIQEAKKSIKSKASTIQELKHKIKLLSSIKERSKEQKNQLKEVKQQQNQLQEKYEQLQTNTRNLKARIKVLVEEQNGKNRIISALRDEKEGLEEKLKDVELDTVKSDDKYKKYQKEIQRKDNLIREYKSIVDKTKNSTKLKEDQAQTLKTKLKEAEVSQTRKDTLIRNMRSIVNTKNEFETKLKGQIAELKKSLDQEASKSSLMKSKYDRLQQMNALKEGHMNEHLQRVKRTILSLAEDQVKAIEKLQTKIEDLNHQESLTTSFQEQQSLQESLDELQSSISIQMLNLSPDEFNDIMASTTKLSKVGGSKKNQMKHAQMAGKILKRLKRFLLEKDVKKSGSDALGELVALRVDLEKDCVLSNKRLFFSSQDEVTMDSKLQTMKQREEIYENTIQELEKQISTIVQQEEAR